MGEYGGRNFSKKSSHGGWVSKAGNKGIPPGMPSKGGKSKGFESLQSGGDKGMSYVKKGGGNPGAPRD